MAQFGHHLSYFPVEFRLRVLVCQGWYFDFVPLLFALDSNIFEFVWWRPLNGRRLDCSNYPFWRLGIAGLYIGVAPLYSHQLAFRNCDYPLRRARSCAVVPATDNKRFWTPNPVNDPCSLLIFHGIYWSCWEQPFWGPDCWRYLPPSADELLLYSSCSLCRYSKFLLRVRMNSFGCLIWEHCDVWWLSFMEAQ